MEKSNLMNEVDFVAREGHFVGILTKRVPRIVFSSFHTAGVIIPLAASDA